MVVLVIVPALLQLEGGFGCYSTGAGSCNTVPGHPVIQASIQSVVVHVVLVAARVQFTGLDDLGQICKGKVVVVVSTE